MYPNVPPPYGQHPPPAREGPLDHDPGVTHERPMIRHGPTYVSQLVFSARTGPTSGLELESLAKRPPAVTHGFLVIWHWPLLTPPGGEGREGREFVLAPSVLAPGYLLRHRQVGRPNRGLAARAARPVKSIHSYFVPARCVSVNFSFLLSFGLRYILSPWGLPNRLINHPRC